MGKHRKAQRARAAGGADSPLFTVATTDDVLRAFERFDPGVGWETIGPSVLPLLPRHTPSPIRVGAPIQAMLGPGILVGFGIDVGPAFAGVTRELVDGWGVADADVVATSLANVRALASELPPGAVTAVALSDGRTVRILQSGAGWASTLLLLPDLLPRFFGPGPHLVGAPCRDVLLAFPADTPLDLVFDLVGEIAWADPAGLVASCHRHRNGALEPVAAPVPGGVVALDPEPPDRPRFVS